MLILIKMIVSGIFGGVLARGIFATLRLRKHSLDSPIGYVTIKAPLNYMTTYDFLSQSAARRWVQYLLFKTAPVLVSFILVAGLSQLIDPRSWVLRILSFIVLLITFYIPDLVLTIWDRSEPDYTSVRLLKALLIIVNIVICLVVFALTLFIDFTSAIPSPDGIKDNLWSSLLVAIIVAWFIQSTNMNQQPSHYDSRRNEREAFIKQQGEAIYQKYGCVIHQVSEKNKVNPIIMTSLLVYENLNRPVLIRRFENILVGLLPFPLTVGIAQVSSDKRLSDEESIDRMGEILGKGILSIEGSLNPYIWLSQLLEIYNDEKYAKNVIAILTVLYPDWCGKIQQWNSGLPK